MPLVDEVLIRLRLHKTRHIGDFEEVPPGVLHQEVVMGCSFQTCVEEVGCKGLEVA